ncbi:hypothetical protein ACFXKK_02760 [Streptomyces globisporus]|uniref:hypothetical protein n=1 Tax=Streptomyces griseus group TaxID=629295 RepID=UPI003667852F
MPDELDDVVGVIKKLVEDHVQMPLAELRRAADADPEANSHVTTIVHWYGLLTDAQEAVERAEDALLEVLDSPPGELGDRAIALAHRVNAAVTVRDGRAAVLSLLVDPDSAYRHVWRGASPSARRAPALQTTAVPPPVVRAAPVRGGVR